MASIGGAMFVPIVGIITPAEIGAAASILMIAGVALGGRASLFGPALGAMAVGWGQSSLGSVWPDGWTYLVARRIRMLIESWDRASLDDQQQTIGRLKSSGAPLGGDSEFDAVDFADQPANAHVALAHPKTHDGVKILRRGYSFTDGMDSRLGELDAGLFFISFQRDPAQFVALQRKLGSHDALNEYIKHVGSGVFHVPPGIHRGGSVGDALFS